MKRHMSACKFLLDQDAILKDCGIFNYKQLCLKGELYSAMSGQERAIHQSTIVDKTARKEVAMSHSILLNEYNVINE